MHKTILFLFAFLITPITASYAVVGNTEITVNPDYDGSGSSIGGTTVPCIITTCEDGQRWDPQKCGCILPTNCADRPCLLTAEQTNNNENDFAKCVWIDIPKGAILKNGVTSADGKCQKRWYCKNDGYYTKVHTKLTSKGTAITNRFSHVSCVACPYACRDDDDSCINNVRTSTEKDSTENYSTAQSVNDCYLKILPPAATNEITGSDEIGSFRTKKSDTNPFACPY